MTFWVLTQVLVNLVLLAGVAFLWFRLNRPAKDDPRLSRGLQLLQSKISIIEDLSDRTDTQFQQLTMLMEQKIKDIQDQMHAADRHVRHIETSTAKSLEVAKIFQDKIPHQEIIERQNTIKYVKAARMAFKGSSVEDIAKEIDLPRGELEFIAKVNRTQLQFSENDLPDWIEEEVVAVTPVLIPDMEASYSMNVASASLSELGDKFRQALTAQEPGPLQAVPASFQAESMPQYQEETQTFSPSENSIQHRIALQHEAALVAAAQVRAIPVAPVQQASVQQSPTAAQQIVAQQVPTFTQQMAPNPTASFPQQPAPNQSAQNVIPVVPQQIIEKPVAKVIATKVAAPKVAAPKVTAQPATVSKAVEKPTQKPAVRARSATPTTVVQPTEDGVRKVVFPRVDMGKNLG